MGLIASAKNSNFVPAPEGTHQGVCVDIVDLGEINRGWGPKPMIRVVFQLSTLMETGKRFIASRDFNNTLNEGKLLPFLTAWKGAKLTKEELDAFPLENLLGVNGNVQILHNEGSNGNIYANIMGVIPLMVGQTPMMNDGYIRMVDRPEQGQAPSQPPAPRSPFPSGAQPQQATPPKPLPSAWANLKKPIDPTEDIPF